MAPVSISNDRASTALQLATPTLPSTRKKKAFHFPTAAVDISEQKENGFLNIGDCVALIILIIRRAPLPGQEFSRTK